MLLWLNSTGKRRCALVELGRGGQPWGARVGSSLNFMGRCRGERGSREASRFSRELSGTS